MKFLRRILELALSTLLTALIIVWSLVTVMGSATTLSNLLAKAQVYSVIATSLQTSIAKSLPIPEQYQGVFIQALERALSAEQIKAVLDPLLVDLVSWLNQPQNTPTPQLIITITPIKTALISGFQAAKLSSSELAIAQAQINQQLSDQIDLDQLSGQFISSQNSSLGVTSAGQLSGPASVKNSADLERSTSTSTFAKSLIGLKQAYQALKTFAMVGLLVLIVLVALLIYVSRHDGRAMLRRPAWVFLWSGIITIMLYMITRFVGNAPANVVTATRNPDAMMLAGLFAREAMNIVILYGLVSLLVGGILYGLSFFIKRPLVSIVAAPPVNPNLPHKS